MGAQGLTKQPKKLSIADLKSASAQVVFCGKPVKESIVWSDQGEDYSIDVWVRRYSYETAVADLQAISRGDSAQAHRIAKAIVDEDGQPVFSVEDITGEASPERGPLSQSLTMALLGAIYRVNNLGKHQAQPTSTEMPSSGASLSSTVSVAKPSKKRKPRSVTPSP